MWLAFFTAVFPQNQYEVSEKVSFFSHDENRDPNKQRVGDSLERNDDGRKTNED